MKDDLTKFIKKLQEECDSDKDKNKRIILLEIYFCNWRICVRIKSRVAASDPRPILWIIGIFFSEFGKAESCQ